MLLEGVSTLCVARFASRRTFVSALDLSHSVGSQFQQKTRELFYSLSIIPNDKVMLWYAWVIEYGWLNTKYFFFPFFHFFSLIWMFLFFYILKIVIGGGDLDLPFLTLTSGYWSYCCCPSSTMLPSVSKIGFTSKIRSMSGNLYPNSVNNKLHLSLSCVKMPCFA